MTDEDRTTDANRTESKVVVRYSAPEPAAVPSMMRWVFPVAMTVILAVVGYLSHATVERAMKDVLASKLETILNADVTALKIWLEKQESTVESVAAEPEVRRNILELVRYGSPSNRPVFGSAGSNALERIRGVLGPLCRAQGYVDFLVIDPQGVNVGALDDRYLGLKTAYDASDFVKRALAGKTVVSRPYRSPLPLADDHGVMHPHAPTMFAATPVRDGGGGVAAVLGLRIRPSREFTGILSVARPGKSGETYALDAHGLMISQSRFDEHLKRIGLLPDKPHVQAILNVVIKNPRGNMVEGFKPIPRDQQPLTKMAAEVAQGKSGVDVEGYRDYRGVPVLGAWTWLPEYGFGVATEEDAEEAFRPLMLLRYTFGILFGLLLLTAVSTVLATRIISSQRRRMLHAEKRAEKLGQYTLERKLGVGGAGAVWKARHAMLRRPCAIKLLRPERTNEEAITRFEREVQLTSQLTHLNTIRIFDYGRTPEGVFYYVMEYLPGVNLHTLVEACGPLPEGRVIHIVLQVCASLNEAHATGMIHRDIKPENIIIYERGGDFDMVKVCDFGLVKFAIKTPGPGPKFAAGTPKYLAPEAIVTPGEIDGRSDLYSLGAVAYFLLAGRDVFEGGDSIEICRKQVHDPPQRPSEKLGRPLSEDLEDLVMACLEKDPDKRPQNTEELKDRLSSCRDAGSWTRKDAQAWWEERGHDLVERELAGEVRHHEGATTVMVDLEERF